MHHLLGRARKFAYESLIEPFREERFYPEFRSNHIQEMDEIAERMGIQGEGNERRMRVLRAALGHYDKCSRLLSSGWGIVAQKPGRSDIRLFTPPKS